MKKKLYKVSYTYTKSEDVVYFSADSFIEVINHIGTSKEIINIICLSEIEILVK